MMRYGKGDLADGSSPAGSRVAGAVVALDHCNLRVLHRQCDLRGEARADFGVGVNDAENVVLREQMAVLREEPSEGEGLSAPVGGLFPLNYGRSVLSRHLSGLVGTIVSDYDAIDKILWVSTRSNLCDGSLK